MSDTVSHHTEEIARREGVFLVRVRGTDMLQEREWVAYDCHNGQALRRGNLGWVTEELDKLGARVETILEL